MDLKYGGKSSFSGLGKKPSMALIEPVSFAEPLLLKVDGLN